jgi:signal peptidase I
MSPRRFAAGLAGLAFAAGVAWLAALAVVLPLVVGWKSVVVTSGSMSPAIHRGDVVLGTPYDGRLLGPGTVVVFQDGERGRITHRIVARNDDGTYTTRGDANPGPDSTPLRPDQIEAAGRALVPRIGILPVLAREGRWGDLAVLLALLGAAGVVARWGLQGRPRALDVPVTGTPVTRRRATVVGALAAAELAMALIALPGAKAAWMAPTSNGASSMQSAASWQQWYLNTPIEGANAVSAPWLTMSTSGPAYAGALPNYDTDRNPDVGLTVAPTTLGLAESDPTKFQQWYIPPTPGSKTFAGDVRLRLPTAVKDFNPTAKGRMIAGLYKCHLGPSSCALQATATVDRPGGWSSSLTTFVDAIFDFGTVNIFMPGNQDLAVKVVVDAAGSDDSMWLAYDTRTHAAALQKS